MPSWCLDDFAVAVDCRLEGDKSKPPVISDDAEMGDDPNDRQQDTTHTAQTGGRC